MAAISSMHLIETSPMLREMQLKKLHRFTVKKPTKVYDFPMTWHDSIEEILEQEVDKDTYTVVIAHEFFDALPVHLIEVSINLCHIISSPLTMFNRNARMVGTTSLSPCNPIRQRRRLSKTLLQIPNLLFD